LQFRGITPKVYFSMIEPKNKQQTVLKLGKLTKQNSISVISKWIFLIVILILTNSNSFSQNRTRYQSDYDAKTLKFGYVLGFPTTNYYIRYNKNFIDEYYPKTLPDGTVRSGSQEMISSPSKIGLRMGGIMNFRVDDYFDFRLTPSVCVYRYELIYQKPVSPANGQTQTSGYTTSTGYRENAWFELPMAVKYKSERRGNFRMYLFAGTTLAFESNAINRTRRTGSATSFKITDLRTLDMTVNYGIGLEMFREYFKFAPELHFSHGMRNLVDAYRVQGTQYAKIDKLATHSVSLNFLFE
jgi:hypothetical protein